MFTWNPVFTFVMEVKYRYEEQFGKVEYKEYDIDNRKITCFEYWIETLNVQEYSDRIKYLEINQKENLLLIRYAKYSDVLGGEEEVTLDEIWNMYDGFYLECRSIVIDLEAEEIALCPFKKFRNLNECAENMLDVIKKEINTAKSVEISNKLDGSMQSARWYKGSVLLAGSQAINPENSWRLADGYRMLSEDRNYIEMLANFPAYTFIFEYISLADAHVVKYTKEQEGMYLVGIRNTETGEQMSYDIVRQIADNYMIKRTEVFNKTFDEVLEEIKTIKSEDQEGFVINIDGHLIKVKGDDYVSIHKILSKISSINLIIHAIADGNVDDLRSKIPAAYMSRLTTLERICRDYCKEKAETVSSYYNAAPKEDKKEFMLWVDSNVPKQLRGYVRNMYLGVQNNYLKSYGRKYLRLVDMGIKREDYATIFTEEE